MGCSHIAPHLFQSTKTERSVEKMLLKPVNPNPIHTAIDASTSNEFSCEVISSDIDGAQFYIWDENGNMAYQGRGNIGFDGLACLVPSNKLSNGNEYSWQTAYWSPFALDDNKKAVVAESAKCGERQIKVKSKVYCQGTPYYTGGEYRGGFYRMAGGDDRFFAYTTQYSGTTTALNALKEKYREGDTIYFYDAIGNLLESKTALEIDSYDNWLGGTYLQFYVKIGHYDYEPWMANVVSFTIGSIVEDMSVGNYLCVPADSATGGQSPVVQKIEGIEFSEKNEVATISISHCVDKNLEIDDNVYFINSQDIQFNTSPEYYFRARKTPYFGFSQRDFTKENSGLLTLNRHFHDFQITYCEYNNCFNPTDVINSGQTSKITITNLKQSTAYTFNFQPNQVIGKKSDGEYDTNVSTSGHISADDMIYTELTIVFNSALDIYTLMVIEGDELPNEYIPYGDVSPLGEYQIKVYGYDEVRNKYIETYKTEVIYNPNINNSAISFQYDCFADNTMYKVEVCGKTTEGDIVSSSHICFFVDYLLSYSDNINVVPQKYYNKVIITPDENIEDANNIVLFRKDKGKFALNKVCEIPLLSADTLGGRHYEVNDYCVSSNNTCTYYYTLKSDAEYVNATLQSTIDVDIKFDEWVVIGLSDGEKNGTVDVNNIWRFALSVEPSVYKHNYDKTTYEGFGKYAAIGIGNRDYRDFSFSAYIGDVTCDGKYYDDVDMIDRWAYFCSSPVTKLYKDPKGRVMLVDIVNMDENDNYPLVEMPTTINVSLIQTGEIISEQVYTWELI